MRVKRRRQIRFLRLLHRVSLLLFVDRKKVVPRDVFRDLFANDLPAYARRAEMEACKNASIRYVLQQVVRVVVSTSSSGCSARQRNVQMFSAKKLTKRFR